MRKAAHPSGGMDSSNPHRWRGEQLHHHGDGVCLLFVLFCAVSSDRRHSSYVDKYESNLKVGLLMKQSVPPRLAPYLPTNKIRVLPGVSWCWEVMFQWRPDVTTYSAALSIRAPSVGPIMVDVTCQKRSFGS
jgi:hypothetical protein